MISDEAVEAAADCAVCDHPYGHHDAGECWTNAQGREVSGGSACGCGWYEPKAVTL